MHERKNRLAWGILLGMSIGSSIAAVVYAETGEPFCFGLIGVGLAFGLLLGAAFNSREHSAQD